MVLTLYIRLSRASLCYKPVYKALGSLLGCICLPEGVGRWVYASLCVYMPPWVCNEAYVHRMCYTLGERGTTRRVLSVLSP